MANDSIRLGQLATVRSGDKGNHANLGVVAYRRAGFEYLSLELTQELVTEFFSELGISRIERFELPRIWALNFLLHDALAGGASRSLRLDTQGKLLGTAALEILLPRPDDFDEIQR
jgi:hypothetical protein